MSTSIPTKVKNFLQAMMKPSPSAVFSAVKTLKPHVPLIKFRKSSGARAEAGSASVPTSPMAPPPKLAKAASVAGIPAKPNAVNSLPVIEDWQLPHRFRRRPIDQQEVAYINRGGRE